MSQVHWWANDVALTKLYDSLEKGLVGFIACQPLLCYLM